MRTHDRARWKRRGEYRAVILIKCAPIIFVSEVDSDAYNILERRAASDENAFKVCERLFCLRYNIFANNCAGRGVARNLSGDEHHVASFYARAIGASG